jgi:peptidoglycan hydrolase-like protein with peptidoglycan-binding domain
MQTYLNGYINAKLTLDGDFGSKTTAAVKTFQRKMNLSADGIVGPNTRVAVCGHTGIPVNSGATHAQIVAAADVVIPMCRGWGFSFN